MAQETFDSLIVALGAARAIAKSGVAAPTARKRVGSILASVQSLDELDADPAAVLGRLGGLAPPTRRTRLTAIRAYYQGMGLEVPKPYSDALRAVSRDVANERSARLGTQYMRKKAQAVGADGVDGAPPPVARV